MVIFVLFFQEHHFLDFSWKIKLFVGKILIFQDSNLYLFVEQIPYFPGVYALFSNRYLSF